MPEKAWLSKGQKFQKPLHASNNAKQAKKFKNLSTQAVLQNKTKNQNIYGRKQYQKFPQVPNVVTGIFHLYCSDDGLKKA